MFKQKALDAAPDKKRQKLLDQREHYRQTFVLNMTRFLGSQDAVRAHFEAIHPMDGTDLWVHDSTRERLLAVKADLEAKGIPMPATSVGQSLRGRHLHDKTGAGMMTHGLGLAVDWKAYAAPHVTDPRLHALFQTVTGGPPAFHLTVGGHGLGPEARRDLIEQMGQGTADPDRARQLLDSISSEYRRLAKASADFKTSLPESTLTELREVERLRAEASKAAQRLAKSRGKDRAELEMAATAARQAFEAKKAEVQARLEVLFAPWVAELEERAAAIEAAAAEKGVDLRDDVTTKEDLAALEHQHAKLAQSVRETEKKAAKLLAGVRETRRSIEREIAGIEAGLPDGSADRSSLLATAQELLVDSEGLDKAMADLLPDQKPPSAGGGKGHHRSVEGWRRALAAAGERLAAHHNHFAEIEGPLQELRPKQESVSEELATHRAGNAEVVTKVGKDGLAKLQADRKSLRVLDETAKALRTDIDFVLKSRDVKDPGITQLLGLMPGTEGGGFFTPDPEQGGEAEAAKGAWSGSHGYNLEFFKAMVQHGFDLGVAWEGTPDTMHFELVEGRRLAASGGTRPMEAGTHS